MSSLSTVALVIRLTIALVSYILVYPTAQSGEENPGDKSWNEAFFIEPTELRISLSTSKRSVNYGRIKVVNKENYDVAIRIDCFLRDEDLNGGERRSQTKDVLVDSPEFVLPAGRSRDVILRYAGARNISKERTYRVVVKQREEYEGANKNLSLNLGFVHVVSFSVAPAIAKVKAR